MFKVKGYIIGIIEILLFLYGSETLRKYYYPLGNIDTITYFWIMMTILTMYWECAFICQYDYVADLSNQYIVENKNVWESSFDLSFIIPWKLSPIFYADYAAYADREYMLKNRDWSRIIEGTHAIFCGLFSTMAIINKKRNLHNKFLITLAVSMGSQLMNSILYMCSYFIELNKKNEKEKKYILFSFGNVDKLNVCKRESCVRDKMCHVKESNILVDSKCV